MESEQFKELKALVVKLAVQRGIPVSEHPEVELTGDPANPLKEQPRTLSRYDVLDLIDHAELAIEVEQHFGADVVKSLLPDGEPEYAVPAHLVERVQQYTRELIDADRATLEKVRAQLEVQDTSSPAPTSERSLEALKQLWIAERKPGESSVRETATAIRRFIEVNGAVDYPDINPEHARKFKAMLLGLDLKAASKKRQWVSLSVLLNRAVKNNLLDANPLDKVAFDIEPDAVRRSTFSPVGLQHLFNSVERGSEYWWLCRIALYTGARLSELLQLTSADIIQIDGVQCLRITDEGGKRVKTVASVRDIPIHQQLIVDGFLDWASSRTPIFTKTRTQASTAIGRLFDRLFPNDDGLVFHSFRHTFKTAARHAELSEDVHDRLTGHAPVSVGRRYGGQSIPSLKVAIDRIRYGIESE